MARAVRLTPSPGAAGIAAAGTLVGIGAAGVVVMRPDMLRLLLALLLFAFLLGLLVTRPRVGILAVFGWLLVMAFVRRVLIGPSGWTSFDPLLLVSPLLAIAMCLKLFVLDGRELAPDRLSRWVLGLLLIAFLQAFNPLSGGVLAGLGGLLFVGVPLLWFLVGRELASDALTERLGLLLLGAACVVGVYGLVQTEIGFPPWDDDWIAINGYVSLNVGETVRAFGTFASSAEYALVLGSGVAVAMAWTLRGRLAALTTIPLLGLALFLASGRSALIMAIVALIVVVALNTRKPVLATVIVIGSIATAGAALTALSGTLSSASQSSGDLASHQLDGLSNPLDPNSSTLLTHLDFLVQGVKVGVQQPLGYGTGASNNSAGKLGGDGTAAFATEVDISNAFVSWGIVGGNAFVGVVVLVLRRAFKLALAGRFAALPIAGILVVTAGQWLIGGNYALCALVWLLAGWLAAASPDSPRKVPAS